MTDVTTFKFGEGDYTVTIRTLMVDGGPVFIAKDVAEALGYTNPQKAVRDHCKQHKTLGLNDSFTPQSGRSLDPQTVVIPEGDVYRLVIRSKLSVAEAFETWVMETVLPALRRDGGYVVGEEKMTDDELIAKALEVVTKKLADAEAAKKSLARTLNIEGLKFVNGLATTDSVKAALGFPTAQAFNKWTLSHGVVFKTAKGYALKEDYEWWGETFNDAFVKWTREGVYGLHALDATTLMIQ